MNTKNFYCYSYPLKNFLMEHGEYVVVKGINPNTQKRYWVFERTISLDKLLTEWKTRKK